MTKQGILVGRGETSLGKGCVHPCGSHSEKEAQRSSGLVPDLVQESLLQGSRTSSHGSAHFHFNDCYLVTSPGLAAGTSVTDVSLVLLKGVLSRWGSLARREPGLECTGHDGCGALRPVGHALV